MNVPDLYQTATMMTAILSKPPTFSFLRDTVFSTDPAMDIFSTEEVLVDIMDGKNKMAPIVMPRVNGVTVERAPFRTEALTPALVAPKRPMTVDDLQKRRFGEQFFSGMNPEDRKALILAKDLDDLEKLHTNREEYIAAQCMQNNGYVLVQYADEYGKKGEDYEIRYYDGTNNPAQYTPAVKWDQAGADVYGDLCAMVRTLTEKGRAATMLIANPQAIDTMLADEEFRKMADNRRISVVNIEPTYLPNGASYYGTVNIDGHTIKLYGYNAQFQDDRDGITKPVFSRGKIVITSENAGKILYGAIGQVEEYDGEFHFYGASRVPKFYIDTNNDSRTLRVASRPLFQPREVNPWVSADVL